MSSRQERYAERQYLHYGESEVSPQTYNMVLGGVLTYGFLVNCFMVAFCFDAAVSFVSSGPFFYIAYFAMVIVGSLMINGSKSPAISFLGYNLIVIPLGLILSVVLNAFSIAGLQTTIITAFAITAIVTISMMALSMAFPHFFLSLGRTLGITLLITIVAELIMAFMGANLGFTDYIVVLIFCGYIGYDWARANACAKTIDNAVDMAAELYVDIINLFIRILNILARSND